MSYRDLEVNMTERGVAVDHATLSREVEKYAAATAFFVIAIGNNGWPDKIVIDKSGSNKAGLF